MANVKYDVLDRGAVAGLDHPADQLALLLGGDPAVDRALEDVVRRELGVARSAGGVDERDVVALDDLAVGEDQPGPHAQVVAARVERDGGAGWAGGTGGPRGAGFGGHTVRIASPVAGPAVASMTSRGAATALRCGFLLSANLCMLLAVDG